MQGFLESGLDLLRRGGWVMYPLLLLSVTSLAVMLERALSIREAAASNEKLLDELRALLMQRRYADALARSQRASGPIAAIMAGGLANAQLDFPDVERAMEELASRETPLLQKNLGVLDTIITMAPLLGLLGTITGMIRAFNVVSTASSSSAPTAITGGVAEALIATATGLTIAIVTLPVYNYLTERVREIVADMETRATQLLNILTVVRHQEEQERLMAWQSRAMARPEVREVRA